MLDMLEVCDAYEAFEAFDFIVSVLVGTWNMVGSMVWWM